MIIVRMKQLNVGEEEREKIRKEIEEQTQQEVVVLPCGCELVEMQTIFEGTGGTAVIREKRKITAILSEGGMCPRMFGMKGGCRENDGKCEKCWDEALQDESEMKRLRVKDLKNILESLERMLNGLK